MKEMSEIPPNENYPNVLTGILKRVGAVPAHMMMLRTSFEDRMLQAELPDNKDYVHKV